VRSTILTGVSRGLGAALFDECNTAGDRLLALGRRFTDAQQALAAIEPDRVRLRETDLSALDSLPDAEELADFVDGGVDRVALVHNAAVFDPFGPIGALARDQLTAAIAVNLIAPMLLTNALFAHPLLARGRTGGDGPGPAVTVLFLSSSAAHRIAGGRSVYATSKRAGETFFASLAEEHAEDPRVRVTIVDPGILDTQMQVVVRKHAREATYFPGRERFLERYARGELPSPVDVAREIFLQHLVKDSD
jgi:NAD(P)-dependent dehydrogenase (short-subunit alcohol dehydrogenase family)